MHALYQRKRITADCTSLPFTYKFPDKLEDFQSVCWEKIKIRFHSSFPLRCCCVVMRVLDFDARTKIQLIPKRMYSCTLRKEAPKLGTPRGVSKLENGLYPHFGYQTHKDSNSCYFCDADIVICEHVACISEVTT